jgi:hypothetical protein
VTTSPAVTEQPKRKYPPPSSLLYPGAPWGRWDALCRCWMRHVQRRIAPERQEGARQAVAIFRQLLEFEPTPDNAGKPRPSAERPREPGDDSDAEGEQ